VCGGFGAGTGGVVVVVGIVGGSFWKGEDAVSVWYPFSLVFSSVFRSKYAEKLAFHL